MKKSETSKDFVEDIDRFLMGKKTLKGILYNVNQDERSFMFSVRKFEAMDEKENSDNVKRLKIDEKNNLNKITYENVEDFKKSIEKIESIDKQKQIIENEINRLTDIKREEMCNFYIDFIIKNDENIYEALRKYYKTNNELFFTNTIEKMKNLENCNSIFLILKLYFKTYKNESSFKYLLEYNLKNKIEDCEIFKNKSMLKYAVNSFYKIVPKEARVRIEQIIFKDFEMWNNYIKNEINNIEYCRTLFRRVVNLDWTLDETKDWFKKWLEFEKNNNGNQEEVKNKAKEYVLNYKKDR
ncbi:rRNA biogenesis protein rrp5 [Gurleya vavrai]